MKNWLSFFKCQDSKINPAPAPAPAPAQVKNPPLEPCDSPLVASGPKFTK